MKQKIFRFRWLIIAVMVLAFAPKEVQAKPTVTPEKPLLGDGSDGNPYQIKTKENLYWLAEQVNNRRIFLANAILMNDIVVNEGVLNPDGSLKSINPAEELIPWTPIESFGDTFDGRGHTISGLYFSDGSKSDVGLFGSLWDYWGKIINVGVVDSYFYGEIYVGGVCGQCTGCRIENCYSTSTVEGNSSVGGVCGMASALIDKMDDYEFRMPSQIRNSYNYGIVKGKISAGGVCGMNDNSFIYNCYYLKDCVTCEVFICTEGTEKTANEFASGEVAWLLNGSTSEDDLAWGQKVTLISDEAESKKQPYPVFGGEEVFCKDDKYHNHYAYCSDCGGEPKKNDNGYYEIGNAQELYWFAEHVNSGNTTANAILTEDIVLYKNLLDADGNHSSDATNNWAPIGDIEHQYTGTFDGQGYTVSGLYFNDSDREVVGLFGHIDNNGSVKNVGVKDSYFKGFQHIGGVCGENGGTLSNCYSTANVSGNYGIGGICGYNGGTINNCYNTGNVSGTYSVGAVCGYNNDATIENCYFLKKQGETLNGVGYNSSVGIVTNVDDKTAEAFAGGEVAWLLNRNGLNYGTDEVPTDATSWKWYQKLGSDKQPVLQSTGSNTVYAAKKKCSNSDLCGWANSQTTSLALEHEYGEEITLSGKADENTQNLHSYIQTCTTPDCGATKVADENKKVIKGLNVDDDQIEITRENRNAPWKTTKNITLSDDQTKNMYHAPVEFMANGVSYTRQISDGYCWATVCLPYEISISNYTNKCKFYELSGVETDKITLTEITEETTIAAGTPVFVKANEGVESITFSATGETKMLKAPTTGSNAEGYTLTGVFDLTTLPQNSGDLFIKNDKMWDVSQVADKKMKVKIFRAYLKNNGSVSGAPQRSIAVDGEATAISDALDTLNDANAEYYDTSGRRINSLQKGVNIIRSGNKTRKVIIK